VSRSVPQAVALFRLLVLRALPGLGRQLQAGLLHPDQPLVPNPSDISNCLMGTSPPELSLATPPPEAAPSPVSTCRASACADEEQPAPPLAKPLAVLSRPLLTEGTCSTPPSYGPGSSMSPVFCRGGERQPLSPQQVAYLADRPAPFVPSSIQSSLFRPPRLA
jgi:hypothetical protein